MSRRWTGALRIAPLALVLGFASGVPSPGLAQTPALSEQVRTYLSPGQIEGPYRRISTVYPRPGFMPRSGAELLRLSRQAALAEGGEAILLQEDALGRMEVLAIDMLIPEERSVASSPEEAPPARGGLTGILSRVRRTWNRLLGREEEPVELCVICGDISSGREVLTLALHERWGWKPVEEKPDSAESPADFVQVDSLQVSIPGPTESQEKPIVKVTPSPSKATESNPEIIVAQGEQGMDKATLQSLGLLGLLGALIVGRVWQKRREALAKAAARGGKGARGKMATKPAAKASLFSLKR